MLLLNVGCGNHRAAAPWVNVDAHEGPGVRPDVRAAAQRLPYPDGAASAVYCGHVLEHLNRDLGLPAALAEIRRVLSPGGRLCVVGPDCDRVELDPEWHVLRDVVRHGGGRWAGDVHRWRSTGPATLDAVRPFFPDAHEIGIGDVDRSFWPLVDGPGWQFAIEAVAA